MPSDRMVNCPQCGEEVDPSLHIHTPPGFFATGKKPGEQVEDRWPVVTILANGRVADAHAFDDVNYVSPPEQTYYPESAPNVLSPDEARRVEMALAFVFSHRRQNGFEIAPEARALKDRLKDYADAADEGGHS